MTTSLFILLIICFIFIFILVLEPLVSKHKIGNNNEYGSARFSSVEEIKRNFKKEKISCISEVGFPIYFDKKLNYVYMDKETPHWLYLGSTGSGKSITQVIPFCSYLSVAREKRSAFITDPKGEIFEKTSKMFSDRGYEILTIDFRNPEKSNRFNILEPIIKEWEEYINYLSMMKQSSEESIKQKFNNLAMSHFAETNRLITSLAYMITAEKQEAKDPFWNNSARQLLEGLIGFFLEEYKLGNINREQITMTSIRVFQNSMLDEKNARKFKTYLDTREYGSKSKDSLTSIITASENTYKSITSVFGNKMNIFDDINVSNVTSSYDKKFDELGLKPTVLYVIVPDEDKIYFTLVSIIIGLLYKELVKIANKNIDKKLPIQVDWLLDEFANCPPLADIEAMVSVARSRGMRFHFFVQSLAQLDNVYGKEVAQIILDNCGLVYLKTNTQETAEAISRRLGKKTIESNSISQSVSFNKYDGNKSTSLMARELLTADEVKQLHYKMIIFPTVGYPVFRDTIIYKKFKIYNAGTINRKIYDIKNLNYTYFTVEDIKSDNDKTKSLMPIQKDKNDTFNYEDLKIYEKNKLTSVINIVENIIRNKIRLMKFKENNARTFVSFEITGLLTQKEKSLINARVNKKAFEVIISNDKENNDTVLEIHLKNPLEIGTFSEKGKNNV